MAELRVRANGRPLRGRVLVPADKSISHRAAILSALSEGETRVENYLQSETTRATLDCLRALGADIEQTGPETLVVRGRGLHGLREPSEVLFCLGSGTTMRLLAGVCAGQDFLSILDGTAALKRRPMARVVEPLRAMGATVLAREDGRLPPLCIRGGGLHGIDWALPVASAQVKSAVLLAGLRAEGSTTVREPGPSRDHTERMLRGFGASVEPVVADQAAGKPPLGEGDLFPLPLGEGQGEGPLHLREALTPTLSQGERGLALSQGERGLAISQRERGLFQGERVCRLLPPRALHTPGVLTVPGDISSAAFFLVAALLVPGSKVILKGVGLNPTRTGLLDVLAQMGARVEAENRREESGEPVADLVVGGGEGLRGTEVGGELVPRAIDEFPILAVAATQAEGETVVRDAAELRVKESDRITSLAQELRRLGAEIEERADGFAIQGPRQLHGARVFAHKDHRLAMALAVAGLVAEGETIVEGWECVADSYPGFAATLAQVAGGEVLG